jgi:type I restriction enzyme S subunit
MREDWVECKIGDVFAFLGGGTPSKNDASYWNGDVNWASIKDIKGQYLHKTEDRITKLGVDNSSTNIAQIDEIILATRINPGRPILSKIVTAINQDLKIVRFPNDVLNLKFAYFLFKNLEKDVLKLSSGTTVLGINLNNLNSIQFPLPPLPEQRAIVKKIEALFSSLDAGIADLKKAQEQLKIYRQAVLKKAFEGELTKEWRRLNDRVLSFEKKIVSDIGKVKGGKRLPKGADYVDFSEHPYIRVTDFENLSVNQDKLKYISNETHNQIKRYIISSSDVYISIAGSIGLTGCIPENLNNANLTENAAKITNLKDVNKWYLAYYLNSPVAKDIIKFSTIGNTQPKLALFRIEQIPIPLPSLDEQAQIVKEIESRLSVCDAVEQQIKDSLSQAEALRQSILKKAFEGKLLSEEEIKVCQQEVDYEPASVLLEKIKKVASRTSATARTSATGRISKVTSKKK